MGSNFTRRRLIRTGAGVAVAAPLVGLPGCGDDDEEAAGDATTGADADAGGAGSVTPQAQPRDGDEALERLLAGNERFVRDRLKHEERDDVRRAELAEGQEPFAIIIGCADSRVPPEVIFDEGLGKLFVIRVAGNTAEDPLVVGSAEYAAVNLGSVVLMVLGHEECGAVHGAVDEVTSDEQLPGSIGDVTAPIVPVVAEVVETSADLPEEELLERSIRANVERAVEQLNSEQLLRDLVTEEKLTIVGAEYHFESGKVELI